MAAMTKDEVLGMIILGGQIIEKDTIYTPAAFPGLWHDDQIEGIARVASAVKRHGCVLIAQLLHVGLRSPTPFFKTDPARDPYEYNAYTVAPSQMAIGEIPVPSLRLLSGLWTGIDPRAAIKAISSSSSQMVCAVESRSVSRPSVSRCCTMLRP